MKKFSLLLIIAFPLFLHAQTWPVDTIKRKSEARPWLINTSLRPVFGGDGTPWGLMIKREYKENGAFRIYNTLHVDNNVNYLQNNFNLSYALGLGYEERKTEEKWTIFYGMDVRGEFDYDFTKAGGNKKIYSYAVGLSPFIGASYRINKYLSLSSEMGVKMMLGREKNGYEYVGLEKVNYVPVSRFLFSDVLDQIICLNYHF